METFNCLFFLNELVLGVILPCNPLDRAKQSAAATHTQILRSFLSTLCKQQAFAERHSLLSSCVSNTTSGQKHSSLRLHTLIFCCSAKGKVVQYPNAFYSFLNASTKIKKAEMNPGSGFAGQHLKLTSQLLFSTKQWKCRL